jgi:CRP-like cAMP-binding protein/uncharacterized membrane protein YdbT with pleckstrin-like domain
MTTKAEFLGKLDIFAALEDSEIDDLAAVTDEYEFDVGAVIAYQRDVGSAFFIVRSGRLFAQILDHRGIVRETKVYQTGDYFDDAWLFAPGIHPATVKASESGRLLIITETNFLKFLETHPKSLDRLNLSELAAKESKRSRLALPKKRRYKGMGLMPDELVELETRRTRWLLPSYIIAPILGMIAIPLVFLGLLGIQETIGWGWFIAGAIIPFIILTVWAILGWYDWYNDYFIITNYHIIHYEFDLSRLKTSLSKTPIDRIQSVEIAKPDIWANMFNVGTVRVTTAAQEAVIFFDYVKNPEAIRVKLSELRQRVQELDAGRIQAELRDVVEGHFQKPEGIRKYVEEPADIPEGAEVDNDDEYDDEGDNASLLEYLLIQFINKLRPYFRGHSKPAVQANVVTYSKHWIVLLPYIWQPSIVNIALIVTIFIFVDRGTTWLYGPLSIVAFITGFWWVWRFEDWRNDKFQVTDRYVIDINRRPFGFGESRTQAELGNVQNVNAYRSGLVQWLFNYGTVYVETAGAFADITFDNVRRPNDVQAVIFGRRDAFRRRQQVADNVNRRREYVVMLDVYQQAQEQERIPQRTPLGDDEMAHET